MTRFSVPNVRKPIWMVVLLDERPPCFSAAGWKLFLDGVRDEAMGDSALRRRMERGGMPAYCESCTPEHRASMTQATRCMPLKGFADV